MFYNELIIFYKGGNLYRIVVDGKILGNGYIFIMNYIWCKYIYVNVECIFWNNLIDYYYVIFCYGCVLLNKVEVLFGFV